MANITKIDGYDIKDAFAQKGLVFYEEPTGTAGSGSSPYLSTKWQVESVEGTITEPYNGMRMVVKVPVAGVSTAGVVLSIDNGVTWHPVRYNNSTLTTHYAAGTVTLVVYDSTTSQTAYITAGTSTTITGVWRCVADYDSNTTNIVNILKPGGTSLLKTQLGRYRLLLTVDGTTVLPFNNTNYTNATTARAVTQEQFDPFGQIYFYNTTTVRAANYALPASALQEQYYSASYSLIGYSYVTTLTANKWIFLKATMQSNGMAILNADTSTGGPIVQDLPTTDDGFIYIFLGYAASSTLFTLHINHPIYYYKDGKVRLFTSAGQLSSKDAIGNISATGTMTDTADAPASGDYLITRDASTNAVQTSNINAVDVNTAVTNSHTHVNIELSTTAQDYDGKGHTIKLPAVSPYSDTNYYHSTPNPVWSGTDGTTFKAANNGGTGCPNLEFTLPNASTTQKGVALLGATGGAATYARVEELALTIVDEKVVQTASTTDAYYPILMSESASPTSGAAAKAKYSTDATFNPNMNTFRIRVPNDIDPTKYESMFLRSGAISFWNEYTGEHVQMLPQNIMIDVDGVSSTTITKTGVNIHTEGTDVRYQTKVLGAEIELTESIATQADPFGPVHYRSQYIPTDITFIEYDTAHQDHGKILQTTLNTSGLCITRNDASDPTTNLATINVDYNGIYNSLWTASKFVKTDANKILVTADLTSGDVTTALGYTPSSTDTHVNVTGDTTSTKYLLGTSVTPSATVQNVESVSDTSIKVNETVRSIGYKINVDANYAMICGMGIAKSANIGSSDTNTNMNMWIRAMGSNPIIGFRCSGSSQIWYFQATSTALYLGPTSSSALWMQANGRAGIPNGFYVGASNSTTSACRLTYDTTNGGMLQLYTGNNSTKKIELKGIDGTASFASTVTVGDLVDSGLTASKLVKTDANKKLISYDLTSSDITTALGFTPTSNTGTVTSVQVQATSPVQSSTSTASTTTLSTTISLESGYGDTQNPYNTKNPNTFLSGPVSGNASAPTFRTIDIADLPAAVKDRMRYLGTKDCSNTTLNYYLGLNKNDTFTIVPSGNYSTLNVSTQLGRSATAYIGDVVTCYDYDGTLGSTHGYWYIIPSGRVTQYDYSNIGQSGDKYPLLGSYTQSPNTNTYPTGYDTHVTIEPSTHSFYLNDQMTDTETGTVSVETQVSPSTYIQSVDWTLPNNAGYATMENQLSPSQFTMNYIETYGETTTNQSLSVQLSSGNVILNLSNDNNTTEITPEVVITPSIEIVDNNLHGKKLKLDTNGFVAATTDADYTRTISQLTFDANNDATITMGDSVNSQYMYGNISDDSTIGIMSYNTTSMYVGTLTYILIKNTSSAAKTVTFDIQTQFELVGGGTYSIPNGKYMEFSIFVLNGTTAILTNSNEMDSITGSLQ